MNFAPLNSLTLPELADLFNAAFAEYYVSINLSPEILREKIYTEDIDLNYSMGCFEKEKPVGFMLHAFREIDGKCIAYNAGTGVIKAFRGQNATVQMYRQLFPLLQKHQVSEVQLEVIDQNAAAIKSYEKAGFRKVADLPCFKGNPKVGRYELGLQIRAMEMFERSKLELFCDWQPTWQHATETVEKMEGNLLLGAYMNRELVGFLIGQTQRARVLQFAVDREYRRKGIGRALFVAFAETVQSEISVINVDDPTNATRQFLENTGMKHFLTQFKMKVCI